jgi:hypothetical protein
MSQFPVSNEFWPTHGNTPSMPQMDYILLDKTIEARGETIKDIEALTVENERDPSGRSLNTPGAKADAGKNLPWLFQTGFAHALHETSRVCTLGAQKYTPGGWATVPNGVERYMEAFARHTSELARGQVFDSGPTGLGTYHISQMIWNLLAAFELQLRAEKEKSAS